MGVTIGASTEYYEMLHRDYDADEAAAMRAARAELPCSECGSNFGMRGGWDREAVTKPRMAWARLLYACSWDDHELYESCLLCNPMHCVPAGFTLLTSEQVATWLAHRCECEDCKRERGE